MRKNKLTLHEKETIILYNQAEKEVEIYTHDPVLIRKLKDQPQTARLLSVSNFGGYTFVISKSELIIRPRKHSTGVLLQRQQKQAEKMRKSQKSKGFPKKKSSGG
jgi:hypothetical protein